MNIANIYSPVIEEENIVKTVFQLYTLENDNVIKKEFFDAKELIKNILPTTQKWIRIIGLEDSNAINEICTAFSIHSLVIEDIFHVNQRAKAEKYEHFLYVVLRNFYMENEDLTSNQLSFIVEDNLLISIEESPIANIQSFAEKVVNNAIGVKKMGEDYWLYKLLDSMIDSYIELSLKMEDAIEDLEGALMLQAKKSYLLMLLQIKQNVQLMRKEVLPVRELLNTLAIDDIAFFDKKNKYYLRNLQDHTVRMIDVLENNRETLHSLMDLYHTQLNNRMNEVMKTLTILSSVFIPLTFIVGVYGMNFDNMPELRSPYGYYAVWAIMIFVALAILAYFKRKKYF